MSSALLIVFHAIFFTTMNPCAEPGAPPQKLSCFSHFPPEIYYHISTYLVEDVGALLALSRCCVSTHDAFKGDSFLKLLVTASLKRHKIRLYKYRKISAYLMKVVRAMTSCSAITPQHLFVFTQLMDAYVYKGDISTSELLFSVHYTFHLIGFNAEGEITFCSSNFGGLLSAAPLCFFITFLQYVAGRLGIDMEKEVCLTPAMMLGFLPDGWYRLKDCFPCYDTHPPVQPHVAVGSLLMMSQWKESVALGRAVIRQHQNGVFTMENAAPCFAYCPASDIKAMSIESVPTNLPLIVAAAYLNVSALELAIAIQDYSIRAVNTAFYVVVNPHRECQKDTAACLDVLCNKFCRLECVFHKDAPYSVSLVAGGALVQRQFVFFQKIVACGLLKWKDVPDISWLLCWANINENGDSNHDLVGIVECVKLLYAQCAPPHGFELHHSPWFMGLLWTCIEKGCTKSGDELLRICHDARTPIPWDKIVGNTSLRSKKIRTVQWYVETSAHFFSFHDWIKKDDPDGCWSWMNQCR